MPEPTAVADIEWGLTELRKRGKLWLLYTNYYSGIHRLTFATKDWRNEFGAIFSAFSDNLTPTVIHAVRNRLAVTGFTAPGEPIQDEEFTDPESGETRTRKVRTRGRVGGEEDDADRAWDFWNANRMDRRQKELFRNALLGGYSYALLWPSRDDSSRAVVYPNSMEKVAVRYDPELPDRVVVGVKAWMEPDKRARVNLYYTDRIEKYVTRNAARGGLPEKATTFIPYEPDDGTGSVVSHEFGFVPIVEFTHDDGKSRLQDVIPLQDALNKAVADMLIAMEFHAIPQRTVVGYTPEYGPDGKPLVPFRAGKDGRVWGVQDPNARFGQFEGANLAQFITVHDSFRGEIARVSSTPLHYLLLSGSFPSGEALRAAEAPLEAVVGDTRDAFGPSLEALVAMGLRMQGTTRETPELSTLWRESIFRGMKEHAETVEIKRGLGVSMKQGLRELGYSDDEIEMMQEEEREGRIEAAADADAGIPAVSPEVLERIARRAPSTVAAAVESTDPATPPAG